jgi:hypothetical protein
MANKQMRKIIVDGVEYRWRVGKLHVLVRGPGNFKLTPDLREATCGYHDWRDFEKRNARIEPSMIEKLIRQHIEADRW